jgi:hypothetical protein
MIHTREHRIEGERVLTRNGSEIAAQDVSVCYAEDEAPRLQDARLFRVLLCQHVDLKYRRRILVVFFSEAEQGLKQVTDYGNL